MMMNNKDGVWADYVEVKWDKRGEKRKGESKEQQLQRVKQTDSANIATKTKLTQLNKSILGSGAGGSSNLKKIEKEEETFKLPTVSKTMAQRIATARVAKKLSQKDLAMKLNLPFKIINDYEKAIAIPNHLIINKIESVLGVRLRDEKK